MFFLKYPMGFPWDFTVPCITSTVPCITCAVPCITCAVPCLTCAVPCITSTAPTRECLRSKPGPEAGFFDVFFITGP